MASMKSPLSLHLVLPNDGFAGALAARVWRPDIGGPAVAALRDGVVVDVTATFPTIRDLCETPDPASALRGAKGETLGPVDAVIANCWEAARDISKPWFLAPADLARVSEALAK